MSDKKAGSRIEEQTIIKFLVAEGCKAVKIHGRLYFTGNFYLVFY